MTSNNKSYNLLKNDYINELQRKIPTSDHRCMTSTLLQNTTPQGHKNKEETSRSDASRAQ
jgi:hypothetical protein